MYPFKPAKRTKITRGSVKNNIEKCIFCGNCQRVCPAQAICVVRDAGTWEIDRMRCISCNACVEACPTKCMSMDAAYTPPMTARAKELLKGTPPAKPAPKQPTSEKTDSGASAAAE